jgi:hypothetical protein
VTAALELTKICLAGIYTCGAAVVLAFLASLVGELRPRPRPRRLLAPLPTYGEHRLGVCLRSSCPWCELERPPGFDDLGAMAEAWGPEGPA